MVGAGYGTDGSTFSFGIKENNFNGKGIKLASKLELNESLLKVHLIIRILTLHIQIDQ